MKHGSKSHREPGSMGPMHSGPGGRVIKGKKLPGRMGGNNATVLRLTVAKVDKERNLIMIKGAVPGANGTFLVIRQTVKPDVIKKNRVENKPHAVNPQKASARK
jgi:large subunit ribosomal protein L3